MLVGVLASTTFRFVFASAVRGTTMRGAAMSMFMFVLMLMLVLVLVTMLMAVTVFMTVMMLVATWKVRMLVTFLFLVAGMMGMRVTLVFLVARVVRVRVALRVMEGAFGVVPARKTTQSDLQHRKATFKDLLR